jgi:tRNA pseudouridine32 synthase / 23S rRNA pseudouridine746 synthase
LKIVHEDADIIVVDKPAGILCIPSEPGVPSLAETVFDHVRQQQQQNNGTGADPLDRVTSMDQMVVHRLGFDTAGLLVFAKTIPAVRTMNALFRTRKITRQYEVLVAGHVVAVVTTSDNHPQHSSDSGLINLPLMRCYEHPPYMRISTDPHQQNLLQLDAAVVGKKLLEAPKQSLTHYQVVSREFWKDRDDLPVTRMTLTSMTGRTHQLNVHCTLF